MLKAKPAKSWLSAAAQRIREKIPAEALSQQPYAALIYNVCPGCVLQWEDDGVIVMNQRRDLAFFVGRERFELLNSEEFSEWIRVMWNRLVLVSMKEGSC